jgi:transposase
MAPNFIECGREQAFLMPPSLRDWVPGEHLVWTMLEAVEEMELSDFYADYRDDGHGRPAYDPKMMVALLLYAYAKGNRSSRRIERECQEDVAYRVICANRVPDHSTIAEFRRRHETALAELFNSVLSLCRNAGVVWVGVIAIDGTKIAANASLYANRSYEWIVREILKEAEETDRAEDERYGAARGYELPERLRTREGRRAALREAKRELEAEQESPAPASQPAAEPPRLKGRAIGQGRRGWLREGRRQLDERRAREARPIARSREARPSVSKRRLEEELEAERSANEAYEAYRSRGVMRDGRRFGGEQRPSKPTNRRQRRPGRSTPPTTTRGSSAPRVSPRPRATTRRRRSQRTRSSSPPRSPPSRPTSATSSRWSRRPRPSSRGRASPTRRRPSSPIRLLAHKQMERVVNQGSQVLIPPDSGARKGTRPGWDKGIYAFMRRVLATERGRAIYRRRMATVEPMIGQMKFNRGFTRFQRRGRSAVRSQWRLAAATHNLLKLHTHRVGAART